jgi:photosystem II stability/assembly factor-like uncharacterized protein
MKLRAIPAMFVAMLAMSLPNFLHAQWLPTNGPLGGPARTLASNDTFLFAELHGGVFRSSDNGEHWTRLKIGMPVVNVNVLVARGADIYAATWGNGIYRSTDNGEHWISDGTVLRDQAIECIALYGPDIVAATVSKGIFRSTNRGVSWRQMNVGLTSNDVISRLSACGDYLFGSSRSGRLFRYSDSTGTWSRIDSIWLVGRITPLLAATDSVILIGWEKGVVRSTDYGESWRPINNGLTGSGGSHPFAVGGRFFNTTIYDGKFYKLDTTDTTWGEIGTGMNNGRVSTMTAIGSVLFAGTGDGIYRSTDHGRHWELVNQGMVASHVTALAAHGATVVAGTHGGGIHRSTDNGATWSSVGTGLPHLSPVTAFLLTDSTILAGTMYEGLYRSTDSGASWHEINNELTDSTIIGLAANDSYLFAATREGGGIFRSDDNGAHWSDLDMGLESPHITALAVNGSTIIAGVDGEGVYRSTDNGDHWKMVTAGQLIVYVYSIAINGASMVLADRFGLYYSINNGATWTRADSTVGGYSVAVADSSRFYAGGITDRVLRSSDGGRTWKPLKERLESGLIAASSTNLFVGTAGYGVLRQPLSEISIDRPTRFIADAATSYPNLVLNNGKVIYRLNRPELVRITIYDAQGNIVARPLVDMMQMGGEYIVTLGAKELAVGSYRCSIVVGGVERVVRFVVAW